MFEINNENSQTISMYQWGITESGSYKPILQTYGIVSCVGVTFYNNEAKQAVLAHFAVDFDSDYSNAERMINMIIEVLKMNDLLKLTSEMVNTINNVTNSTTIQNSTWKSSAQYQEDKIEQTQHQFLKALILQIKILIVNNGIKVFKHLSFNYN